ncbi:MAG: hypothetical protein J4G19_03310, partial [Pseudomonadales bacterium]|nr:hypothetical protein [Pseudomonadales bacterium]
MLVRRGGGAGATTRRLQGEFTVEAALTRLLAGTRLQGRINEWGVLPVTPMTEVAVSATKESTERHSMQIKKSSILGRIVTAIASVIFATSAPVTAQEDAGTDTSGEVEEIVVTGSHIKWENQADLASPIDVVGLEDIAANGWSSI